MPGVFILDTSLLLSGRDPPPGTWVTTPEAAAEISPGGRDAKRFEAWRAAGLEIRSATRDVEDRVDEAAMQAGSLGRLSQADRSLLALAKHAGGTLITDDKTMLDVAKRLGVETVSMDHDGIEATIDWKPRCQGCGKWFDAMPPRKDCTICGSPVVEKRVEARR